MKILNKIIIIILIIKQVPWDGIDPGDIMQKILKNEQLKPL